MTDDDNLLDEIFHEARKGLKKEKAHSEDEPSHESRSSENLNISANDTWRYQDDSFKFACRKIKTKATEIEKRLSKVTPADILASLDLHVDLNHVSSLPLDEDVQTESKDKKRVRFVVPSENINVSSRMKEDRVKSLLHRIRQWLDPNSETSYPQIGDCRNKICSAYWDAVRVVGQGRTSGSSELTYYNNPFDPRLQFNGLGDHLQKFSPHNTDDTKPSGNYLLWLDKVSDVVDECLQNYTSYLKSLRQESDILRKAVDKSESAKKGLGLDSSLSLSRGFDVLPSQEESQTLSEEERVLLGRVKSLQNLWDGGTEKRGLQIPRRITSRKASVVPRRRTTVMSEVKTSQWTEANMLGKGDDNGTSKEISLKGILRKKKNESPELPPSNDMVGRNSPQVWQRIAEEHIDEESLKHLRNATKERAGVKIMRPSVSTGNETVAKSDSWAARVAQHIYTSTSAHTRTTALAARTSVATQSGVTSHTIPATSTCNYQSDMYQSNESKQAPFHIRAPDSVSSASVTTASQVAYAQSNAVSIKPCTSNNGFKHETCQEKSNAKIQYPNTQQDKICSDTNTPSKDPHSIAKTSTLNPLNSSPEWLRKLMAKTNAKSACEPKQATVTSSVSTILSQSINAPFFVPSTLSEYRPPAKPEDDAQQQLPSQTREARCRVPPGFENTALDNGVGRTAQVATHQQQRPVHLPSVQQWQQPQGAVYTGVGGETFIQQPTTFQHGPSRVVHQFQRPVSQIGGNLAIWHPQPPHASYMLTDVHGKAIGVGVPGWNPVEIQPRPHIFVHQAPIPAPQFRPTARQGSAFPVGSSAAGVNPENFGQQAFNNHMVHQQPHLQQSKIPEGPSGSATGYERGDHFNGFTSAVPPPQVNYQSRIVPQFIPGIQHGPPLMPTEYAVFTASQHKPYTISKQPNLNQNNNSVEIGSSVDSAGECQTAIAVEDSARARPEVRAHKPTRAIRANLIQLA